MPNDKLTALEEMIFAAQSLPQPSEDLRRKTLARSVRAYHEGIERRRKILAASLLIGLIWIAGSAQQLLAQPSLALGQRLVQEAESDIELSSSAEVITDEWQHVERTNQDRWHRSQILRRACGASREKNPQPQAETTSISESA